MTGRYIAKYRAAYLNRRAGWWVWDTTTRLFVPDTCHPGRWGKSRAYTKAFLLNRKEETTYDQD